MEEAHFWGRSGSEQKDRASPSQALGVLLGTFSAQGSNCGCIAPETQIIGEFGLHEALATVRGHGIEKEWLSQGERTFRRAAQTG